MHNFVIKIAFYVTQIRQSQDKIFSINVLIRIGITDSNMFLKFLIELRKIHSCCNNMGIIPLCIRFESLFLTVVIVKLDLRRKIHFNYRKMIRVRYGTNHTR